MRMYDLIEKKKRGHALDKAEICWMIQSYTAGQIPDYQMAAFLMAVCFQGMDLQETTEMTLAMAHSGQMADLSDIAGVKVDKHSTGGVGDKTTLIAAPMAAACGIPIAKMSGRGLGFTGGTVDKLESIPGYRTVLPREEFFEIVNEVGISLIGQSGEMAVADKKIYALRDVTATVDSLPLIASSIMSKKIAAGADAILLDVKTGSGAFMKTREQSAALARTMVGIGNRAGRRTAALITDMDTPLGDTAGNAIEVQEAIWTLRGKGPADLTELCIHLAGNMLWLAGQGELEDCLRRQQHPCRTAAPTGASTGWCSGRVAMSAISSSRKNSSWLRFIRYRRRKMAILPRCRPMRLATWSPCWEPAEKEKRMRSMPERVSALQQRPVRRSAKDRRLLCCTPIVPSGCRRQPSGI